MADTSLIELEAPRGVAAAADQAEEVVEVVVPDAVVGHAGDAGYIDGAVDVKSASVPGSGVDGVPEVGRMDAGMYVRPPEQVDPQERLDARLLSGVEEFLTADEQTALRGQLQGTGLDDSDAARRRRRKSRRSLRGRELRETVRRPEWQRHSSVTPRCFPSMWECCRVTTSIGFGILGGLVLGELITNSMIQISFNPIFSIIFCIVLLLLALALCMRGCGPSWVGSRVSWKGLGIGKRLYIVSISAICFAASVCSIVLCRFWLPNMHWAPKVILYVVVAIALAFSLSYAVSELLNLLFFKVCKPFGEIPFIAAPVMVFINIGGAIWMGACFGLLFGLFDPEDDDTKGLIRILDVEVYCLPVGAIFGFVIGLVNETVRCYLERRYFVKVDGTTWSEFVGDGDVGLQGGEEDDLDLGPLDEL